MPSNCLTCSCFRPRYKKLVDNIFPQYPEEGLVKNNMDKLIFHSLSSPEKLDRIGEYLYQRASRDITRTSRIGFVVIAMEAMDQLLGACHAQALNLYVESFLKMIQRLLESPEADLQIQATQSFVKFSNIEEDTPSYHRRYEFFVSKFSSMCHNNRDDPTTRNMLRVAGIRGLRGVIRKTVVDDLVENIWEANHMAKIIPSLLFNMQDSSYYKKDLSDTREANDADPGVLADECIQELFGRASFGHVRSVVRPVLEHLDRHHLWVPNEFAVHTFKVIMFSIQTQYSYAVVESLMYHLDSHSKSPAKIRTSMTNVLSKIIAIAAGESVGPSVLEIINSLLAHIRNSAGRRQDNEETVYLESLVTCLGEFTAHLPDYQKVEIMVFIVSKIPSEDFSTDILLREMLLKSLLIVGKNYTSVIMSASVPPSLLKPLLHLSFTAELCILSQQVLHTLIDRHNNLAQLEEPKLRIHNLVREEPSRADTMFLRKNEEEIYSCMLLVVANEANSVDNLKTAYTTLALIVVELLSRNTVAAFITMLYKIQDAAVKPCQLDSAQKCNLHCMTIALLNLASDILELPHLQRYVSELIEFRMMNAPYLLPDIRHNPIVEPLKIDPLALLNEKKLGECLKQCGVDVTDMSKALTHRHSWVETASSQMRGSISDSASELGSNNSTPRITKKFPSEGLTFDAVKKVLTDESCATFKERERLKQKELFEVFRHSAFEDIVNNNTVKDEDTLQKKLHDILDKTPSSIHFVPEKPPIFEQLFPELFAC
ncbi:unnamed protein product [Nesidiocoris tenuis]|uniref:Protein EFR3 homolog cmp44E n=1 Tax=Nesidiocoris tenuis TaxID=355587 RepID=A0A6H5HXD3_9HEMI|nr:unnamed protein product [Nesidiocoris tenuis]